MPTTSTLRARLVMSDQRRWRNKHLTFTQPIQRLIDIWNPEGRPSVEGLKATVASLQLLIGDAAQQGVRLRALGSGWSFSRVAATDGWLLNTKPLNWVFPLSDRSLASAYSGEPEALVFAQCGVSVLELNRYLQQRGRSLKASGASNGQTIAGALSTGTHGSAFDVGAVQEQVVGLHLVVGSDRHVWLERASYPVVTDAFAEKLGAEIIRDEDLFNAALVSFGSFGIIHGVLVETEPLFLLEAYRKRLPFDARLKQTITTLAFEGLDLPHGDERPYHFELVFNPYDLDEGVRTTVMYKRPYRPGYPAPTRGLGGFHPGDDAASFLGELTDSVPGSIPILMNQLLDQQYKPYDKRQGTLGEMFGNTAIRGKAAGSALGVPLDRALDTLEIMLDVHQANGPFGVVVALRFVAGSDGLLAFTKFAPTCIVDLDGVLSDRTQRYYELAWAACEAQGIPFTLHWGKSNEYLNVDRLRAVYGPAVDGWLEARHRLLDAPARAVFTNDFLERCGLAGALPSGPPPPRPA